MFKFCVYLGLHLGDQLSIGLRRIGVVMGGARLFGRLLLVQGLLGTSDQLLDRLYGLPHIHVLESQVSIEFTLVTTALSIETSAFV